MKLHDYIENLIQKLNRKYPEQHLRWFRRRKTDVQPTQRGIHAKEICNAIITQVKNIFSV